MIIALLDFGHGYEVWVDGSVYSASETSWECWQKVTHALWTEHKLEGPVFVQGGVMYKEVPSEES